MIDKKTEVCIKAMKSYLEFWMKFHSEYKEVASKDIITEEEELKFLEAKDTIKPKYDLILSSLDFKYMPHSRLTDPVSDILDIKRVRFISEKNLKKLTDDWRDSYIFLNNILERLENKKRRLGYINPMGAFIKRFFEKREI